MALHNFRLGLLRRRTLGLKRHEATYLNSEEAAADWFRAADQPRIQLMADLFCMNIAEVDIPATLRAVAPRLGHVHLADSRRWLLGHLHIDFVGAFRVLREIENDGWLALEGLEIIGDTSENMRASRHAKPAER